MNTALRAGTRASILATTLLAASAWAEAPGSTKSKALNPDIGINFLGLLQRGTGLSDDRTVTPRNGLQLQEAELQFSADVDPYFRANALFAVAQEGGEWGIDPEEVYAETISIPQFTIRGGKFKLAIDKHNQLHQHAFPFIDAPLINQQLLGDEGLNEAAISVAWLAPLPWYSEVIVQGFDPSNDTIFGGKAGDFGGLLGLKNLFDLSEDLTMEVALSGAIAHNALEESTTLAGADLTFKWRPQVGGKYHALIWQSEYLCGHPARVTFTLPEKKTLGGFASWLQYQFAERWWIQGRAEFTGIPQADLPNQAKQSALLGFFPSEFSGLRLQYDHLSTGGAEREDHTVALQLNISIGAHPAHAY